MSKVLKENLAASLQAIGGTLLVVGLASDLLARSVWVADLLINFRVHFVVCLLVCGLLLVLLRSSTSALAILAGTAWLAIPMYPYLKLPGNKVSSAVEPGRTVYRLLSYNVLADNSRHTDVADYVAGSGADFVLLLETDKPWSDEMDFELRDHYPHRFAEPRSDFQGVTFFSKHPWKTEPKLIEGLEFATLEVELELADGVLRLVGTHPMPPVRAPLAAARNRHLEALAVNVAEYPSGTPTIVAGDLNVTPWSPYFRRFAKAADLRDSARGRGLQNTWYKLPVLVAGLPIDHVLVSPGIEVLSRRIGPPIGSDHRPVIVDFMLPKQSHDVTATQ